MTISLMSGPFDMRAARESDRFAIRRVAWLLDVSTFGYCA